MNDPPRTRAIRTNTPVFATCPACGRASRLNWGANLRQPETIRPFVGIATGHLYSIAFDCPKCDRRFWLGNGPPGNEIGPTPP